MAPEMIDLEGMYCFIFFFFFFWIIFYYYYYYLYFFSISRPGKECDIWSLGILLLILIEMRYPYQSFYKQMDERQRNIEIKNEIKKGLIKDGKVFFFQFFFFMNK
jgi:serine/threonine protein kinase